MHDSRPVWYEDLNHYLHRCGQPLLVGETYNGAQLFPIFQVRPGQSVTNCPTCGQRLSLNDCEQVRT